MLRRVTGILALSMLVLLLPSCAKLESSTPQAGGVAVEKLERATSIPAEWGNLISVSSVSAFPDLLQLWFQDREGIVRMVVFDASKNLLLHALNQLNPAFKLAFGVPTGPLMHLFISLFVKLD